MDPLGEHLRPGRRELHIGAALMDRQIPALDRQQQACLVFGRLGTVFKQHRAVNLLDVDAAFLFGLDAASKLEQLAHRRFWIGVGARLDEFHHLRPSA